jgi:hypothetical protein
MNKITLSAVLALAFVFVAATASSQSRSSLVYIGATNSPHNLPFLAGQNSNVGAPVSAGIDINFTGLDGSGNQQTMNLNALASAQSNYGRLRTRSGGTLTNTYFHPNNPPFYDGQKINFEGSPDQFGVLAFAGFIDNLLFGGTAQPGYKARYIFFVSGFTSGSHIFPYLRCVIAGNPAEFFSVNVSGGSVAQYFTTQAYPISGGFQQTAEVLFSTQFNPHTFGIQGQTITGLGDFSSTATLTAVVLSDANDNPVSGFTLTSASGTMYLVMTSAVSRKTHGSAGVFDVPLPLVGEPGVECRESDGNHTLVFTFANNVVSGKADVTGGQATAGTPSFAGNTMTVNLSGVTDGQKVTVTLSEVTDSAAQVLPDVAVSMNVLAGDTNGNKTVNATDIGQVKSQSGMAVSAENFRQDVTTDGAITASDIGLVKSRSGATVP